MPSVFVPSRISFANPPFDGNFPFRIIFSITCGCAPSKEMTIVGVERDQSRESAKPVVGMESSAAANRERSVLFNIITTS